MAEPLIDQIAGLSDLDLRRGFESFIEAARRLEESYAELKARADAVDLQLRATNRRLAETLAERETVFRALPVGVVATAAGGAMVWCNDEGERLQRAARRRGCDLLAAEAGQREVDGLTVQVKRVDLPDGGALVVLEDRSRVVELEHEVLRLDRLAGLSELALGVAHEIKNPLNGVMGFASLMDRSDDPDELRRFAAKVHQGLRQVDEIVKAMLAFARPSGGASTTAPLGEIVDRAAQEAGLSLERVSVRGDAGLLADRRTLARVLANLFRNSAEATAGVDGAVHIDVEIEDRGRSIALCVTDDGPGVPRSLGDRVFEPFVSSKERGHGLGLALAARVLAFLGGSVDLLNPGEPGASFLVSIPKIQAHGPRDGAGPPREVVHGA